VLKGSPKTFGRATHGSVLETFKIWQKEPKDGNLDKKKRRDKN